MIPDWFSDALASGRLIDYVLLFMAAELGVLFLLSRGQRGLSVVDIIGHLSAGAFLLLALRSALVEGPSLLTAGFLIASLPAHLFDLARRARRKSTD